MQKLRKCCLTICNAILGFFATSTGLQSKTSQVIHLRGNLLTRSQLRRIMFAQSIIATALTILVCGKCSFAVQENVQAEECTLCPPELNISSDHSRHVFIFRCTLIDRVSCIICTKHDESAFALVPASPFPPCCHYGCGFRDQQVASRIPDSKNLTDAPYLI
ncbi:hypothetical protein BZA77DRAFT_289859 [Pyronema omphalodes]|nr:hypothetical protein BZA77DRAFT_289859 [Pyronema omphalodes]